MQAIMLTLPGMRGYAHLTNIQLGSHHLSRVKPKLGLPGHVHMPDARFLYIIIPYSMSFRTAFFSL